MTDLRHAPTGSEPAVRPPDAAVAEHTPAFAELRAELEARAVAGASAAGPGPGVHSPDGQRPSPYKLPPGAVGTAALLGIQRAAGNRAATLLLGPRSLSRSAARPTSAPVRAAAGLPGAALVGAPGTVAGAASPEMAIRASDETSGLQADRGPGTIDALHAPGTPRLPAAAVTQRVAVQRDGPQQITPSFTIPIEPEATKKDLGSSASYVKGSIALKGEVKGEIVEKGKDSAAVSAGGTSNAGGQAEITLGEQKGYAIFDSLNIEKVKETMAFELSKKKLDVSFGAEATIKTRYDWLKGIVGLKFVIAGVEWDKVSDAVALGVEISGGLSGEGTVNLNSGYDVKLSVKVLAVGEVHPNWPRIAGEVGKRVATEGGKAAVEATTTATGTSVVAIDMAAVASAAAAILIPLAAAIAMGYGAFQGMKNAKAAREAAGYGVQMRAKAEQCAKGFAQTLTGHPPGNDEGSAEAEAQIQSTMASTHASREMVVAAATQEQGGYGAIYDKNLKRIKEKLYAEGCAKYDEQSKPDWGFIEDFGPEWGMRGVFRNTFRIVLFGGT